MGSTEDESSWFWSSKWTFDVSDKYDKEISANIEMLDIGRSLIWTSSKDSNRMYLLAKMSSTHGYQINVETRFCRKIIRGSILQKELKRKRLREAAVIDINATYPWYWEGDEANNNVWNKYDDETVHLLNNQNENNFGAGIPFRLNVGQRTFAYILMRCSKQEGIQRNYNTGFSRRILRADHEDIDLDKIISSKEYDAKVKRELTEQQNAQKIELYEDQNDDDDESKDDEKHDEASEVITKQPTSTIATLATEPLTPKTTTTYKQSSREYKSKMNQEAMTTILPISNVVSKEDVKKEKKQRWKWHKGIIMFTGYVASRAMSLLDLITDLVLMYKAQQNQLKILTITLFISIFSPYVLSYSSGIKLFIFRKTFDHLQGFKKIFLLLYLLPTGFLYFILID